MLTAVVFNAFSVLLVMLFALLIGFRSDAGIGGWLITIAILLLFTLAMTWVAVFFGLLANSAEGAGVFSYLLMFLLFISSAFTPADSMRGIIRLFAENQPMTPIIETVRSLLLGMPAGKNALISVLWCSVILFVSYIAAIKTYKHKTA